MGRPRFGVAVLLAAAATACARVPGLGPAPEPLALAWHALEGSAVYAAPAIGPDGTLYVTTGRGAGASHLHALAPDGTVLWESAPQQGVRDLDSLAVLTAPVVDGRGVVYVADSDQLWAFGADGSVAWKVELAEHGVYGPLIGLVSVGSQLGGVSANGQLAFFERETGERSVPVLELGAGAGPERAPRPVVWDGLMDPEIRTTVWKVLRGERYGVTRPPVLHPTTRRIFVAAAAERPEDTIVVGVDLRARRLEQAFVTRVPSASGTSLLVSADGERVVGTGADGTLFALAAASGELLWTKSGGAASGLPAGGSDGKVYVPVGDRLLALDGNRGQVLWERSFDELVSGMLPAHPELPGVREGGRPTALLGSAVTATEDAVFTSVVASYRFGEVPGLSVLPVRGVLLALSPDDGAVERHWLLPDSTDGSIAVASDGTLYLGLLAAETSFGHALMREGVVPPTMGVAEPKGGVVAFAPESGDGP